MNTIRFEVIQDILFTLSASLFLYFARSWIIWTISLYKKKRNKYGLFF